MTAFLDIYLYLKSKNNDDSGKHKVLLKSVKSFVKLAIHLFQPMHICQIPHVFLKAQVTFPLNFASIFGAIRHTSSVLFLAQTQYTLVKGAN